MFGNRAKEKRKGGRVETVEGERKMGEDPHSGHALHTEHMRILHAKPSPNSGNASRNSVCPKNFRFSSAESSLTVEIKHSTPRPRGLRILCWELAGPRRGRLCACAGTRCSHKCSVLKNGLTVVDLLNLGFRV